MENIVFALLYRQQDDFSRCFSVKDNCFYTLAGTACHSERKKVNCLV